MTIIVSKGMVANLIYKLREVTKTLSFLVEEMGEEPETEIHDCVNSSCKHQWLQEIDEPVLCPKCGSGHSTLYTCSICKKPTNMVQSESKMCPKCWLINWKDYV